MSQRYRRERARNGMVIDPIPLNVNNNEYAGEWNGYLDRENIPADAISETHIVAGTFVRVLDQTSIVTSSLDVTSQEWQRQQVGGVEFNSVTDTLATEALIHAEWSGGFYCATPIGGALGAADCFRVRMTINGTTVAETGPLSSVRPRHCVALAGDLPLQAGPLEVRIEAMIANISQLIGSPGIFTMLGSVTGSMAFTTRALVVEIRSR